MLRFVLLGVQILPPVIGVVIVVVLVSVVGLGGRILLLRL